MSITTTVDSAAASAAAAAISGDAATVETGMQVLFTRTTQNANSISTNAQNISDLTVRVSDSESAIATLQDTLETGLGLDQTEIDSLKLAVGLVDGTAVNNLNQRLIIAEADLTVLKTQRVQLQTAVTELQTELSNTNVVVNQLIAALTSEGGAISSSSFPSA